MRAQLLHLSGPLRGRTVTYPERILRIGRAHGNEVFMPSDKVEPVHARIDWAQEECKFHLKRVDGAVFVNGNEVEEIILRDDDQIEFGAGGPMARFRVYVPLGATCKPVRHMLKDARAVARHSGGVTATRMLTKDLITQASPSLKIGFPLLVMLLVFPLAWFGGWIGSYSVKKRTADMVTKEEFEAARREYRDRLRALDQANQVVRKIQKEWSRGVCLVHGIFRMRMTDGSWLMLGGNPYEVEYTGSGFLVSSDGHVVTNRHVALPWTEEEAIQPLIQSGAKPEFVRFTATFPGRAPIAIEQDSILRRRDDLDVAVFKLKRAEVDAIPVLPLRSDGTEGEDQRAIVVGYPTGLAALLARASNETIEALRQNAASMADAIEQLAAADQITPTITQGVVSNSEQHVITYDAQTVSGGSGGPVFSGRGDVIAVNYAIQRDFAGNNLGVPIRFARELLPE